MHTTKHTLPAVTHCRNKLQRFSRLKAVRVWAHNLLKKFFSEYSKNNTLVNAVNVLLRFNFFLTVLTASDLFQTVSLKILFVFIFKNVYEATLGDVKTLPWQYYLLFLSRYKLINIICWHDNPTYLYDL